MDEYFTDIGTKVTFQNFCDVCEKLKNAKGKSKTEILQRYFSDWRNLNTDSNNVCIKLKYIYTNEIY